MQQASPRRLFVPQLAPFYAALRDPAETLLRIASGAALAIHGWPKITNPFGNIGFVEDLGFYPGALWSPLLATGEFVGGVLLALGLFTRAAAFVGMTILLVIVWVELVVRGDGYMAAEKAILWSAIMAFFVVRGGNAHSIDARIGREI